MWGLTAESAAVLDVDVLCRVGELAGVQTWPVVLDLWHTAIDGDELAERRAVADQQIWERRLLVDGEPVAWLATALHILAAPERQLEIRTFSADTGTEPIADDPRRTCVARRGHEHVIARRNGSEVDLAVVDVNSEAEIGAILAREFPSLEPAMFTGLSAPTEELATRLTHCTSSGDVADALRALGAPGPDATAIASGLTNCRSRSEIVAVSWSGGFSTQSSGALAVFDTDRGRIVASPSKSPDGRVWTTLSPGSVNRITQATGLLIETLPEGRWMP
ncbi:ESX secretion-associated protein EspG [Gordonia sp. PKS22-38]|uniref:ESX secretion-associated protein EspG n=1 Tax=Gordonia prachuapensis TaxID=3115651 RepID=A0ABU7MMS4_9ACTN|nr:ESX secretion-associated protein EspG [Gordonia sp. PKS22-38]